MKFIALILFCSLGAQASFVCSGGGFDVVMGHTWMGLGSGYRFIDLRKGRDVLTNMTVGITSCKNQHENERVKIYCIRAGKDGKYSYSLKGVLNAGSQGPLRLYRTNITRNDSERRTVFLARVRCFGAR